MRFRLLLLFLASVAVADDITVQWDAVDDPTVVGYRVSYGSTSKHYTSIVEIGLATTAKLPEPLSGESVFASVTAYTDDGTESLPSNEASYTALRTGELRLTFRCLSTAVQWRAECRTGPLRIGWGTLSAWWQRSLFPVFVADDNWLPYTGNLVFQPDDTGQQCETIVSTAGVDVFFVRLVPSK